MKILHIDSSALGDASVSRTLTADLRTKLLTLYPDATLTYRDVVAEPVMYLTGAHLAPRFGAPVTEADIEADLAKGNELVDELIAADIVIIGAPMYNFSIPAQLKSWIDRIVVAGKTFRYAENGPEGLLPLGKRALLVSARGGVYSGKSPAAAMDHQESYLASVLGFIGLTEQNWIRAEGLSMGPEAREKAIDAARTEIVSLSL